MFPIACKSGLTVSGARQHRAEATVLYRVLDGSSCTHTRSIEARTLTVSGARQHRAEATVLYRVLDGSSCTHTRSIEARTLTVSGARQHRAEATGTACGLLRTQL